MKKIKDFDELKVVLKSKLTEFLDQMQIKKNNGKEPMYLCFHPDHNDKKPSVHIYKSKKGPFSMYHCFGCDATGDIFMANHIINKAPLIGYEFITENVKPLCEMFDIDFTFRPLSEEEIEEMNIRNIYSLVKDRITNKLRYAMNIDEKVLQYMRDKEIDYEKDAFEYSLGYVESWDNFINELKALGIDPNYARKIGIDQRIFNPNNLIFSILDERRIVRGFAARNCHFDPDNKIGSKYVNTSNNSVFTKGSLLYNLDRAVSKKVTKHTSLYITEGQTDAIALDRAGLKAVALGSTAFTNEHISLLQKVGETDVVLVLDGDEAGKKNTGRIITEVMEGIRNFRTRIITLPDEEDPDSFVNKYGIDQFLTLPHVTAFEYRLNKLMEETDLDSHELAEKMIPLVVNEKSEIQRDRMCKQLSEICNLPIQTIRREVDLIANNDKIKVETERDAIVDNVIKSLKKNPGDAQIILNDGLSVIRGLVEKHGLNIYDEAEYITDLMNIKIKQESQTQDGHINLWRMPYFAQKMRGTWIGKMMILGGQPNAGKTSFVVNLCTAILKAGLPAEYWGQVEDPEMFNNVCIIYHTVDDSREELIARFLAELAYEHSREVTINGMDNPGAARVRNPEAFMQARNIAYQQLIEWARDGRLIIKDATIGTTLTTADTMIRQMKEKYPDRHIIYVVDNMYNLTDFPNLDDDTKRIKEIARVLKQGITVTHKITSIATVEYRKGSSEKQGSRQALNEMLKESKSLEYQANWIGHLLNELHTDPDNTEMFFFDPNLPPNLQTQDNRSPIIRLVVSKNKISRFKGDLHYYLLDDKATFFELTKDDIINMSDTLREKLKRHYFGLNDDYTPSGLRSPLSAPTFVEEVYGTAA